MKMADVEVPRKVKNYLVEVGADLYIALYDKDGFPVAFAVTDASLREEIEKHTWGVGPNGYAMTRSAKADTYLHHFVAGKRVGLVVDHINGDRLDNRRGNLRHVTHTQNVRNRYEQVGVSQDRLGRKWIARIQIEKKQIGLGRFERYEEAVEARRQAEIRYWGYETPARKKCSLSGEHGTGVLENARRFAEAVDLPIALADVS